MQFTDLDVRSMEIYISNTITELMLTYCVTQDKGVLDRIRELNRLSDKIKKVEVIKNSLYTSTPANIINKIIDGESKYDFAEYMGVNNLKRFIAYQSVKEVCDGFKE